VSVIHDPFEDGNVNRCLDGQPQRRRSNSGDGDTNLLPDGELLNRPRESGDSGVNSPPGGVKRTPVTVEEVEDEDAPGRGRHKEPFLGEGAEPLRRPSEYLRKRCPLCFGGSKQDTEDR
jgi:hypothetical protein